MFLSVSLIYVAIYCEFWRECQANTLYFFNYQISFNLMEENLLLRFLLKVKNIVELFTMMFFAYLIERKQDLCEKILIFVIQSSLQYSLAFLSSHFISRKNHMGKHLPLSMFGSRALILRNFGCVFFFPTNVQKKFMESKNYRIKVVSVTECPTQFNSSPIGGFCVPSYNKRLNVMRASP